MTTPPTPLPLVVLISGRGSNLRAIAEAAPSIPAQVRAVVSNRADAAGLDFAHGLGIATRVLDHRGHPTREDFDQALMQLIDSFDPALVVLAGFMRILTPPFVAHYRGRLVNIHPSLLPAYRGLDTHRRALEAGERWHGASVHFVTDTLDGGPVIVQARVPVQPDDDSDRLATRVLVQEHRIYPLALRWFAEGRLTLRNDAAYLDDTPLPPSGMPATA